MAASTPAPSSCFPFPFALSWGDEEREEEEASRRRLLLLPFLLPAREEEEASRRRLLLLLFLLAVPSSSAGTTAKAHEATRRAKSAGLTLTTAAGLAAVEGARSSGGAAR